MKLSLPKLSVPRPSVLKLSIPRLKTPNFSASRFSGSKLSGSKSTNRLSGVTALTALVAGGVIHIVATLIMPQLATASGVQRLVEQLPSNRMRVLPAATAKSQPLPFMAPDTRLAVCRYDVSDGPVRISAVLPDKGWTVSLYSLQGDNFYVLPAQDFRRLDVAFQLVPQTERYFWFFNLGRTMEASAGQVAVPFHQGLVVVRAPLRGRSFQGETEAALTRAQCTPYRG